MTDVFKFEQQEEGERELVLLVGPRGPLPHQRYATHSDIKAALAEKELCVVPKGRHDWVFAEEVMKRDEEIARLTAALTAEQQRRQEVERERDSLRDRAKAAESRVDWLLRERDRLRESLAAAGKDSGPTCSRCGGSGTDPDTDSSGPPHCVRCKGTGKDSGEGLGPDGESPPEVSARCRVCQGRGRELRFRRVERCTACDGTGRQTIGEVGAGSVGAAVGNEAGTEGADPSGLLRSAQPAPSKPANPGELSANPQSPNHPGIPESSNPSKSSNGSTEPSATVPRGALPEWRITRVRGAMAFLREAWEHNDGAEGESVRLVCDELEALLDAGTR